MDGHGVPGREKAPAIPDFTNRAWQQSRSNVELTISILEGRNQQMPANRGMISDDLARELVAQVRKFAPPPKVARIEVPPSPPITPGNSAKTLSDSAPPYTPTGDFEVDFAHYAKQFDDIQSQIRELSSATKSTSSGSGASSSNPPVSLPPDQPRVTDPSVSALPIAPVMPKPEKPRVAAAPISDRPLTLDDVARGQELFLGHRPLANGGQACIACHAVNRGEAREGGRLGPQLTKAYERLGGRTALSTHLWASSTPTMHQAYLQHSLKSDEVLTLVAYLEDADLNAAEEASPLPLKALLLGLGGTVVGLAAFGTFWGGRPRRRDGAKLNGRAAPALPLAPRNLAPSPVDYIGAGL